MLLILLGVGFWWIHSQQQALAPSEDISIATTASPSPTPAQQIASYTYVWGVFTGTLPCADCSGINTTLTLTSAGQYTDTGLFTLEQVYEGKSIQPITSQGSWTVNRGMPGDLNATVVELTENASNQHYYFLRVGQDTLEMLDAEQNKIPSDIPRTLTRQTGPSVPPPSEMELKVTKTKAQLIGVWQDQSDPHYQTEFKTDGTQVDSYNGEEKVSTTGTWMLFTAESKEPTTFQLNNTDVYIKQVRGTTISYFRIASVSTTNLQLVHMDKGGATQFKKVK